MIDTFQISKTFARPPNQTELAKNGWKPLRDKHTGAPTALCYNSAKGEHAPRLTLSRTRNDLWIVRAEVSPGAWLHGSNLHLPHEDELQSVFDTLSAHVEDKSGIVFDARAARVTRADFTNDFQVGENSVLPIIAKYARFVLPKYHRVCYDETSVYFKNSLKPGKLTKQFKIYSKYHDLLNKIQNAAEIEKAKGLVRLEVSHLKAAVNRLAKSFELPNHYAHSILTKETSEKVIADAMKRLHFDSFIKPENSKIEKLFEICDSSSAFGRIGFLYLRDQYGEDFSKLPFINISPKTLKRYQDDCNKAGICSLE